MILQSLAVVLCACAAQHPITLDGQLADWAGILPEAVDATGDGGPGGADLTALWLADDDELLFMRLGLAAPFDLSENNTLTLYLDTDANPATGLAIEGLGAELVWVFGARQGTAYLPAGTVTVQHDDIRFRGAPTVTADSFEIAIGRDVLPNGVDVLFPGGAVRVVLADPGSGDRLPNARSITYALDQGEVAPATPIALERAAPDDLRLSTYNVLTDNPWNPALTADFGAQIAAVAPDILCFQEIYDHTPAQTAALVSSWLPTAQWSSAGNADCITVSRFPILQDWALNGNHLALIDTTPHLGSPLLLINVHLPCCSNDTGRQAEIDRILEFLREQRAPGGAIPQDTPIVLTGDTNFVGLAQQLTSILTGDIVNEAVFGPDFAPDWDGTPLANLISRHSAQRMGYTWRSDASSFWPGHLDYFIYSDSNLEVANHFVLFTPAMDAATLARYALSADQSLASDHLLVCADVRARAAGACRTHADCADADGDGVRDDGCIWWACDAGDCLATDIHYGEMGGPFGACTPDGTADANDRFHALNCFANAAADGGGYPCEAEPPHAFNVDTGGPFGSCSPDGVCDGHDAFAALNAFAGTASCTCPLDGTPPPAPGRGR